MRRSARLCVLSLFPQCNMPSLLSRRKVSRYNRPVRHRHNHESIDLPPVVAVLHTAQIALDLANRRVRELESVCETLNAQLSMSNGRADAAELTRWQSGMLDEAGQVALNKRAASRAQRASPARGQAH
jgi:hypothetical protein